MRKFWASIVSVTVLVVGIGLVSSGPAASDIPDPEFQIVVEGPFAVQGTSTESFDVWCPGGYQAISGGWQFHNYTGSHELRVTRSVLTHSTAYAWSFSFYNPTPNALVAVATVNCAEII